MAFKILNANLCLIKDNKDIHFLPADGFWYLFGDLCCIDNDKETVWI